MKRSLLARATALLAFIFLSASCYYPLPAVAENSATREAAAESFEFDPVSSGETRQLFARVERAQQFLTAIISLLGAGISAAFGVYRRSRRAYVLAYLFAIAAIGPFIFRWFMEGNALSLTSENPKTSLLS